MITKTVLHDVTFLIPTRIESVKRLENLVMVVDFISSHFDTNIYVLEAANYNNNVLNKLLSQRVLIKYIEDYDPIFHRTKYINLLVKNCRTPYLAVWDADVIVPPTQIVSSINFLRNKKADFVFPYKDKFLDTTYILRELYLKTRNLKILTDNIRKMKELYLPDPVGGAFFAKKETYIESGIENESFYGWGREDGDRINRWKIFGYKYKRTPGPLFHLTHERGMNSTFHATEQKNIKHSEIKRIVRMSRDELKTEVNSWKR